MRTKSVCVLLLSALGCAGAAIDGVESESGSPDAGRAHTDAGGPIAHTPQGEHMDTLARCVQSPENAPGMCQQTRFGERVGYDTESWCAYFIQCPN